METRSKTGIPCALVFPVISFNCFQKFLVDDEDFRRRRSRWRERRYWRSAFRSSAVTLLRSLWKADRSTDNIDFLYDFYACRFCLIGATMDLFIQGLRGCDDLTNLDGTDLQMTDRCKLSQFVQSMLAAEETEDQSTERSCLLISSKFARSQHHKRRKRVFTRVLTI